jgi:DUF2934 family protein/sigma-54-interacting transcriptional regulator
MRKGAMAERAGGDLSVFDLCPNMEVLRIAQPHVLLVGPPSLTSVVLEAMRPALRQPVVENGVSVASLPDEGTVILRNVESLDAREQQALSIWMESSAARVVTICEAPLYTRVTDGSFSSDLYYRLNILTLVVGSRGAIRPTPDDIAQLAYDLYEQRGRANGRDWADWFQAELELGRRSKPNELRISRPASRLDASMDLADQV